MKTYNTQAIVLRSYNYKDSDKFYTFYSKDLGKFTALAKGVRKISSKRGGSLDTLNKVTLKVRESTQEYKYINEVDCTNSFVDIKRDLSLSSRGFYFVELVHKFTQETSDNSDVYDLLVKSLLLLNSKKVDPDLVVNFFEISLMKILGYGLVFDKCVVCDKSFSEVWEAYKISLNLGGFVCDACTAYGYAVTSQEALYFNLASRGRVGKITKISSGANNLIKSYVRDVLQDGLKTLAVFEV